MQISSFILNWIALILVIYVPYNTSYHRESAAVGYRGGRMDIEERRKRNRRKRQRERNRRLLVMAGLILGILLMTFLAGKLRIWVRASAAAADIERDGEIQKLTLGAIGTCVLGDVRGAGGKDTFAAMYEEEGPDYFFERVSKELEKNDFNIANYIGDVSEERQAARERPIKGNKEYLQILEKGSVDFVNMANDRTKDFGQEGYYDTALALDNGGAVTFGHDRVILKTVEGIRLGFVGIDTLDKSKNMKELLTGNIHKAKDAGAQLIVVCMNWGKKENKKPNDGQRVWAHKAIDAGADLVLGYHPDHVQKVEAYEGRYIIYSLGVFCNGAEKEPEVWDSVIYRQSFGFLDGKLAKVWEPEQIPCRISSKYGKNNFQPKIK